MTQDRAAIWLRVSTPDQEVANQEPALLDEIARRGLRVVTTYSVEGRSAFSSTNGKAAAHRGEVEKALADARNGLFSWLLIWALDRITREGPEAGLRLVRLFEEHGVTVVSIQEPWLETSTDDRELLIAVSGHTAKAESRRRSERMKARRLRLLAENRYPGGRPPFVYRATKEGSLVIISERQKIAELIYRWYIEDRIGIDLVIRELRNRRIKSPNGKPTWSHNAVDGILRESAYADGIYLYEYERDGTKYTARIPAEPFVAREMFDRAQQIRVENPHFRHNAEGSEWPLNSMICGECGSRFRTDSGGSRPRTYYDGGRVKNSRHALETGNRCLAIPRLKAELIEPLLFSGLRELFSTPGVFIENVLESLRVELRAKLAELDDGSENLEEQEAELRQRKARLAEAWVQADIPEDKIDTMRAELEQEQSRLAGRRAAADPERLRELDEARAELERLDLGADDWERIARWRDDNDMRMDQFSIHPACAESNELIALRESGSLPTPSVAPDELPRILAEWLGRLHADLIAYPDRIKVDGEIDFEVALTGDETSPRQASHSGRGLG